MTRKIMKYLLKENQYYPTPQELIREILRELELGDAEETHFLEPCAGDGAICREVKNHFDPKTNSDIGKVIIDCIEISSASSLL